MEENKILITWKTRLDDGYIDTRQIECNYERTAHFLHDELTKQDKTVAIRLEDLTND